MSHAVRSRRRSMACRRLTTALRSAHAHAPAAPAAPSAELLALRAKEAGSWKALSAEEKKASLCHADVEAPEID